MKELLSEMTTRLIIGLVGTAVMSGCVVALFAMSLFAMSY